MIEGYKSGYIYTFTPYLSKMLNRAVSRGDGKDRKEVLKLTTYSPSRLKEGEQFGDGIAQAVGELYQLTFEELVEIADGRRRPYLYDKKKQKEIRENKENKKKEREKRKERKRGIIYTFRPFKRKRIMSYSKININPITSDDIKRIEDAERKRIHEKVHIDESPM